MFLIHTKYKIMFGLFGIIAFLFLVEFVCFYQILIKAPKRESADVVVVFGGDHTRTVKGYEVANTGLASFMIVSPASGNRLKQLDKSFRLKNQYQHIVEDRAETTFQNAVLTAGLIRGRKMTSVLLVTSSYHMPRSYFLLKLGLLGSGVKVKPHCVETDRFGRNPFVWPSLEKKRIYNEMIEFWGSLVEMAHYSVTGRLPEKGLKGNKFVAWCRSVLLFDI